MTKTTKTPTAEEKTPDYFDYIESSSPAVSCKNCFYCSLLPESEFKVIPDGNAEREDYATRLRDWATGLSSENKAIQDHAALHGYPAREVAFAHVMGTRFALNWIKLYEFIANGVKPTSSADGGRMPAHVLTRGTNLLFKILRDELYESENFSRAKNETAVLHLLRDQYYLAEHGTDIRKIIKSVDDLQNAKND